MKREQVIVTTDDNCRAGRDGKLQILVVLRVPAVGNPLGRFEPKCGTTRNVQQ
jgi:hypothetical protein